MYKLNHPHIIKLINHFEDDQNVYLIMEKYLERKEKYILRTKKDNKW